VGLQQMFLMIGGGEHAGSGADKIRSGWSSQHWRAPLLETFQQPDRVRLTLRMVSLIPDDTLINLRERLGTQVGTLSSSELQALATADIEGAVSNARLQQLLTDHPADITRMLTSLCERGLLVSDNRRRWTTYELSRRGAEASRFDEGDCTHLPGDCTRLPGDSTHLPGDSLHTGEAPPESEESLAGESELRTLAERVVQTRKAPANVVKATILRLCTNRLLTRDQLGELLHRNSLGLRDRYLSPMVREGLLQLKYPEATNRPDQAYMTVESDDA
jgi:ATP-dependent DNA helicase RecG